MPRETVAFESGIFTQEGTSGMKIKLVDVDLSIVVPCYNEEEVLPLFYETVTKILDGMGVNSEFVFVDD